MTTTPSPRRAKRNYHHGDLRRALIDTALAMIDANGMEAFTLRNAAREIGVSHGAVYRHFEDKIALFAAIAEEGNRKMVSALSLAMNGKRSQKARISALAAGYIRFALEHPAHYRVMYGPRLNRDGRFPTLETAIHEALDLLIKEVGGKSKNETQSGARDRALAFWTMAHGYVGLVMQRRIRVKTPEIAQEYFTKLLASLVQLRIR